MVHMEPPQGGISSANRYVAQVAAGVRDAMALAGVGHSELARAVGISRQTLYRRLYHGSPFKVTELETAARYLGVEASDLLRQAEMEAA